MLILTVLLMWQAGQSKMHVIHFNLFVSLLILGTLVGVICLVRFTRPGEQITRDKIEDDNA